MHDFTMGTCIGLVQTIVGHPLDTIKTNFQNNKKYKIQMNKLYNGLKYPLISTVGSNGLLFHFNGAIKREYQSSYASGFISGIICSPFINYFEVNKVQKQINLNKTYSLFPTIRLGLGATLIRESIGNSLYFGTYSTMRENKLNPFLSGGFAGIISWLVTYPIDVIKTRIQTKESIRYFDAIKKGGLWQGLSICLIRSFLVNSVSFTMYDYLKNK